MYAVEIAGLSEYYGKAGGVVDLDLTVEEGEFFGFIGSNGAGLGNATMLYFVNIDASYSEKAEKLKYFTPFAYGEGSEILNSGVLDWKPILIGMAFAAVCVAIAYRQYGRKDIQ